MVFADTIDYKMNSLIERKRDMLSRIVDGKTPNEESLVAELLGAY